MDLEEEKRLDEVISCLTSIQGMKLTEDQKFCVLYYALYETSMTVKEAIKEAEKENFPYVYEEDDVFFVRKLVTMLFMSDMELKSLKKELLTILKGYRKVAA